MKELNVGVIIYKGVCELDVVGSYEVFGEKFCRWSC